MATPPILVTSRANARVKQLRAAFAGSARGLRGNARLSGGLVAIEGETMLREALASGLPLKTIFLSKRIAPPAWLPRGVELLVLADEVFASAVATQHPQGIAALLIPPVWKMESAFPAKRPGENAPLLLVAAGLQDPGNLGTLVRSAEAFGATAVLTTAGTVSEWNQKALRASAGSVFRVPVVQVAADQLVALKSHGVRLLAAVAPNAEFNSGSPIGSKSNSKAMRNECVVLPATETDLACACALMIGNEGAGLSAELLSLADARITIPTPGRVESLNAAVAGSLLLYEASHQRTSNLEPRTSNLLP
jgi:TrmH family RNA methyltransferase